MAVALWGCRLSVAGHADYLGREQTGAIKGIFAVIILFAHMRDHLGLESYPFLYQKATGGMGQLMVVMFLFYSGYGIMEALRRNRSEYSATFLRRRLLRTWLMFATAVVLFMGLNLLLGRHYSLADNLLALTGWTSVGNSNWFMFVIMALYALTYAGLCAANRLNLSLGRLAATVFALSLVLLFALVFAGKHSCWYDTIPAYAAGMFYSLCKPRIEALLRGRNWLYATALLGVVFAATYWISGNGARPGAWRMAVHIVSTSVFAVLVVLLTMKVKLRNRALARLGVNAFAIYILQRLAMITFEQFGLNREPLLFAAAVIPTTFLIAAIYTAAFKRLRL